MAAQLPQEGGQPLFGLLPAGQPLVTAATSQPGPGSFLYAIPASTPANPKPFAHLAVFLLPGAALPPGAAAAIYVARNPVALLSGAEAPDFRFLGGVGPGKESAIFRLNLGGADPAASAPEGVVIGIEVEDGASVAERLQQQQQEAGSGGAKPSTQVLAQRIIQNAFNFLSSFSGQAGEVEVVPLKAFQEWWKKFEGRVRSDPTFLEREQD